MITHQEIQNLVNEWGLRESIIEKDYVIGWVLWGIGTDPELSAYWAFKGGTSLKKCYAKKGQVLKYKKEYVLLKT